MDFLLHLEHQSPKRALLLGDFMLDRYTVGQVNRISPEAPVCVLNVKNESSRPGGAGNAVLNLISLGMNVRVCGRVGNDDAGKLLLDALKNRQVDISGIMVDAETQTPVKNRLIADQQQLVRVDHENITPLSDKLEMTILAHAETLLEGVDVLALSDYGKGFLTPSFLSGIITSARKKNIPIVVDPKGVDYSKYRGVTLIKPNVSEAYLSSGHEKTVSLEQVAKTLLKTTEAQSLLITRSSEGISLFTDEKRLDFPAHVREVKDVTGAGDTVLAVITLSMAHHFKLPQAVQLANIAAGVAVERVGCQQVTLTELKQRLQSFMQNRTSS